MKVLAPKAHKKKHSYEIHNKVIHDYYDWMRDKDWPKVQDLNIIRHLKQENTYTKVFFDSHEVAKEDIFNEMKSRIKLSDRSPYIKKDNYFYYTRTEENLSYPIYCRKNGGTDAEEEVILDVNLLSRNRKYVKVGGLSVSPDHNLLAYSIDYSGNERYEIKVCDLNRGEYFNDSIKNVIGSIIWHEKLPGFFYSLTNENWRHDKIMFHKLGDDQSQDQLIYHEQDKEFNVGVSKSSSKKYIFINVSGHNSNEVRYIDMSDMSFSNNLISSRRDKIEYDVDHGQGNEFYIHTNDVSREFRLAKASISNPSEWKEYIPANEYYLESFDITKNYLILEYNEQGVSKIKIIDLSSGQEKQISFPDDVYSASCGSTNYEEDDIRVSYSSLRKPNTTYSYDFVDDKLTVIKEQEIPSGFDSNDYVVKRIWANNDGIKIPISILYKKSLFNYNNKNKPLYLYGYGSYGISVSPSFRSTIFSLVDRGVSFAIAHVRGGDDLGFKWYEDAKFLNKKRTFEDFIVCAKKLIEDGYTEEGNISISGGSAGGLLVGNAINTNPELFKSVIAHVPFVDLISTMLDESLPLTPGEFKEWGNPKDKEYFEYMLGYSPYDNIKNSNFPAMYVTAGLSDPRVGYWEAAKWVAKLREHNTGKNKIYLKTNMNFGHSGASDRFDYLKEIAEDYVFLLSHFSLI